MPTSKNRKKHKQKVQQYQQRIQQNRNKVTKMNKMLQSQMMEYYQQHYKDYVLEVAYKENPDFLVKQENGFILNDDKVRFENDVLVWKETNEPVLASVSLQTSNIGERSFVDPKEYTEQVVYEILKRMFDRQQNQPELEEAQPVEYSLQANQPEIVTSGYSAPDWSTMVPVEDAKEVEHTVE